MMVLYTLGVLAFTVVTYFVVVLVSSSLSGGGKK